MQPTPPAPAPESRGFPRGLALDATALLLLAAFPVGAAMAAYARLLWRPMGRDVGQWLAAAEVLRRGDWAAFRPLDRPPLYPALVAALGTLGVDREVAPISLSLVSWALLPALVWLAARPLAGRGPALAAALATSGTYLPLAVGCLTNSQALFNALVALLACLGLVCWRWPGPASWALLGFCAGLALCAKEGGLAYAPLLGIWALACPAPPDRARPWAGLARRLAWYAAGLAPPLAAYAWLCWAGYPGGLAATKWGVLARDAGSLLHAADWREAHTNAPYLAGRRPGPDALPGLPGLLRYSAEAAFAGMRTWGLVATAAPLAALAALTAGDSTRRRGVLLALLLLGPLAALIALPLSDSDHHSFAVAPLALLDALGLAALSAWITRRTAGHHRGRRWLGPAFCIALAAFAIGSQTAPPWAPRVSRAVARRLACAAPILLDRGATADWSGRTVGVQSTVGAALVEDASRGVYLRLIDGSGDLEDLARDPGALLLLDDNRRVAAGWAGFSLQGGRDPVAAPGWRLLRQEHGGPDGRRVALFSPDPLPGQPP